MRALATYACVAGFVAGTALAEDAVFPEEAMADLMRVTLAQTGDEKCTGITARNMRVQRAMLSMLNQVKELGVDPVAAVEYLGTPAAAQRIEAQSMALRERHGVAAEGDEALCAAIRAEAAEDAELKALVRIR